MKGATGISTGPQGGGRASNMGRAVSVGSRENGPTSSLFSSKSLGSFKLGENKSGIISLKQGIESKPLFARSEALAFKAKVNNPLININANRSRTERTITKQKTEFKVNKLSNFKGYKDAKTRFQTFNRMEQKPVPTLKLEKHSKAFPTSTEVARPSERSLNRSPQTVISSPEARKLMNVRDRINQVVVEQKKLEKKDVTPRIAIQINKKQKMFDKFQALRNRYDIQKKELKTKKENKLKPSTIPQPEIKNRVSEALRHVVKTKLRTQSTRISVSQQEIKTIALPEILPTLKSLASTRPELKSLFKTKTQTKPEEVTRTKNLEMIMMQKLLSEEVKEEVEDNKKRQKKIKKGISIKDIFVILKAYFEEDKEANAKRAWETFQAYKKALKTNQLYGKGVVTGKDVSSNLESLDGNTAESKSIEGIEKDGSTSLYKQIISESGEIKSEQHLEEIINVAKSIAPATNMTRSPKNKVVDGNKIENVHNNQTHFLANLDGERVLVRLSDKMNRGIKKPEFVKVNNKLS